MGRSWPGMRCAVCRGRGLTTVWLQKPRLGLVALHLPPTHYTLIKTLSLPLRTCIFIHHTAVPIYSFRVVISTSVSFLHTTRVTYVLSRPHWACNVSLRVVVFRSRKFYHRMFDLCHYFYTDTAFLTFTRYACNFSSLFVNKSASIPLTLQHYASSCPCLECYL